MRGELISVGTEILIGAILNTHHQFLSCQCGELGLDIYYQSTVGDNPHRLSSALGEAMVRSDVVIITGGLGPTEDDITLAATASFLGLKLYRHRATYLSIHKRLKERHLRMTGDIARQAMVPRSARVFPNRHGTAPGIAIPTSVMGSKRLVILIPGPPQELEPMFHRHVKTYLMRWMGKERAVLETRSLKILSKIEVQVAARVRDLLQYRPPVTVGIYARLGEVELRIMAKGRRRKDALALIETVERTILRRFPRELILEGHETIEGRLGQLLMKSRQTLAIAESCTGGLAGHWITNVPGSSRYFLGGVIAYHNDVKEILAGVPSRTIERSGAVSAPTARSLARNIRLRLGSHIGLSITGIAGPGGRPGKPVGLVYIGIDDGLGSRVFRFRFLGGREEIRIRAARTALYLVAKRLTFGPKAVEKGYNI